MPRRMSQSGTRSRSTRAINPWKLTSYAVLNTPCSAIFGDSQGLESTS